MPGLAAAVRRLHDRNRPGCWVLLGLIPLIGGLVLLFYLVKEGTPGPNRFGPNKDTDYTVRPPERLADSSA